MAGAARPVPTYPKISSWQRWHKPEMLYSLRESSSLNSTAGSPHFTHPLPAMASVRLRPNSVNAVSSLSLSSSFINLFCPTVIIYLAAGQRLGLHHVCDPAKTTCKAHRRGDAFSVCLVTGIDKVGFTVRPTDFVCFFNHHAYSIS